MRLSPSSCNFLKNALDEPNDNISRVNMDENLSSVYYDPKRPGGFGGADRLYEDVKKEGKFAISHKEIKEWLMKQDAYTLHKPMLRHTHF